MTTVYVNGVVVKKEDIEKIEIKSEVVKRILASKFGESEERRKRLEFTECNRSGLH